MVKIEPLYSSHKVAAVFSEMILLIRSAEKSFKNFSQGVDYSLYFPLKLWMSKLIQKFKMNGSDRQRAEYISRINKTIDYIELNLARAMTLEELASVASFSKYHFNRIFSSVVGETPFQFILRRRLEKAASFLISNPRETATEIVYRCGFTDISVFSRNFRNYFGVCATQYRKTKPKKRNISQPESNLQQHRLSPSIYFCPETQTFKWEANMKQNKSAEVKELPEITVAYIRNIGLYNGDQKMFGYLREKLFAWAAARNLLGGLNSNFFVVYHDDPTVAISDKLRMSLCITVPSATKVEGEIGKMKIEAGKYAVARFELTGQEFQEAWNWVYGEWLPAAGFQPDDKPYFEWYAAPPVDGNYVIDFCVPVKPV